MALAVPGPRKSIAKCPSLLHMKVLHIAAYHRNSYSGDLESLAWRFSPPPAAVAVTRQFFCKRKFMFRSEEDKK